MSHNGDIEEMGRGRGGCKLEVHKLLMKRYKALGNIMKAEPDGSKIGLDRDNLVLDGWNVGAHIVDFGLKDANVGITLNLEVRKGVGKILKAFVLVDIHWKRNLKSI
jgi:hypothetical protein